MSDSVFRVLEKRGLTTIEIFHDKKQDGFILRGMKEWDEDIRWDRYMTEFTAEDILTNDYKAVGTAPLLATFNELALNERLLSNEQLRNHLSP